VAIAVAVGPPVRILAGAIVCLAATAASAEQYYLIVGGLGGQSPYDERFASYTERLANAARRTVTDDSQVIVLGGKAATRDALRAALDDLAARADDADTLAVFLIGHGSYDGTIYKFNLPGADMDGHELGGLLAAVPSRAQLVVNATSASGAILENWTADNRTLITATRSGAERNATRFAEHWAAALSEGEADLDKNGIVTAKEAFDFASRKVADSYESEGTLATEHPQLIGDAAARFDVARLTERVASTPRLEALTGELEGLEEQIAALRERRSEMEADAYMSELQELLVQLALVQRQIDAETGQ
jgi:polyhydroxyalkanoate synthesis regulator phasin